MTNGLSLSFNYVWSHYAGRHGFFGMGKPRGPAGLPDCQQSVRANYSNSNFDVRHAFKGYAVYQLPFGRGKQFLNNNRLLDEVVGGWQISGTLILSTGNPFTVIGTRITPTRRRARRSPTGSPESACKPAQPKHPATGSTRRHSPAGRWNLRQRKKEQPLWAGTQYCEYVRQQELLLAVGGRQDPVSLPMRKTCSTIPASEYPAISTLAAQLAPARPIRVARRAHQHGTTSTVATCSWRLRITFLTLVDCASPRERRRFSPSLLFCVILYDLPDYIIWVVPNDSEASNGLCRVGPVAGRCVVSLSGD